ncbi:hypothetical protein ACFSUS_10100 [Spirosoma soli]|uniref:Uncharacterized protein n=1 Tax=Spirosoma soli TaxID=1770529 RepID=A0ABW5M3U9_9BACT
MNKLLIGLLLMTSVAVAQTASPQAKTGAGKPASASNATASAAKPTKSSSAAAKPATGSTASTSGAAASGAAKPAAGSATSGAGATKPASVTPMKPLPEHSLGTKLKNDNTNNPYYNVEKAKTDRGMKREYTPRRTESGARKDTMTQRKP